MGASTQEVPGSDPTARGSGPTEAVSGDVGLEVPGAGGSEPGSTTTTQATVEGEGEPGERERPERGLQREALPEVGKRPEHPSRPLRPEHLSVTWGGRMLKS
jgi:hypothetical protein